MIINVTGGPDMSLMEVNEASSIIQEAAHEEANIIFGAVVDQSLQGKVKITVIATGFERRGSTRHVPAAAMQTPVDLHNYTAHLAARVAEHQMEQPLAHPGGHGSLTQGGGIQGGVSQNGVGQNGVHAGAGVAPLNVTRRPQIDLTLPNTTTGPLTGAGVGAVSGTKSAHDDDLELRSPLDVPAFLRRQS